MPLSLPAMNEAYPKNEGFFMHQEDKIGTIEDGKWADLVVLEEDLFEIPAAHIGDVKVHMTLLQGEVVYRR
ncbi:MAG: amidohydrolase family protein [Pseudomonadota bacterium]|nr:amidohydrolase family protein [Pseudomonadales bacterium]MEC7368979.1 amidohydrolase family protein [Pseudomonadota bacterium]MEC8819618.1 amidohydrolase family protein [Pseudomonadota bacterium]